MGIEICGIFFSVGVIVQTAKVIKAELRRMIRKKDQKNFHIIDKTK